METFESYKDYGIRYCQIGGTTSVEYYGLVLKSFPGIGMIDGEEAAKKFIDKIKRETRFYEPNHPNS